MDVALVGGKGASLGELMSIGVKVPPGFVLTTEFDQKKLDEGKEQILKAFDELGLDHVAVRSSATAEDGLDNSFAGQFDTFLGVDRDNLIEKIKECFKSLNSPRIKAYCESKSMDPNEIKMAVVVQEMLDSEVSGVCFTANPVTRDTNQIMIEAGIGLGEAVVSGTITPDNYLVDKKTLEIIDKTISNQKDMGDIGKKQKLSDDLIQELSKQSISIEKHYQKPMDLEWAVEKNNLYILQARPITTL